MNGVRLGLVLLFVVLCLFAEPRVARADAAPLVVLVDPGVPTLARRLREEIEALGLAVRSVPAETPDVPLETRARSANAVAAVRIAPSGTGAVEMTIVDRATGKTVSRRLAIDTANDPASAELIATRTVELLRASLMELASEHPARGEIPVPPAVDEISTSQTYRSSATRFSLAAGPSLALSSGVGPSFGAWAAFGVTLAEPFGVTLEFTLPITAAGLVTDEGRIDALVTQYRVGGMFDLPLGGSSFALRGVAGILLARVALEGSASTPYTGASDDLLAVAPWLGARGRLALGPSFALVAGGDVAFAFPRVVIRSAGREVATWGRPLGTVSMAGELRW